MVGIYQGPNAVDALKLGSVDVDAVYQSGEKVWPTQSFADAAVVGANSEFTEEIMGGKGWYLINAANSVEQNVTSMKWIPPNSFSPRFNWVTVPGVTYNISVTLTAQTNTLGYISTRIYRASDFAFIREGARVDVPGTSTTFVEGDGIEYVFTFGWESNVNRDTKTTTEIRMWES